MKKNVLIISMIAGSMNALACTFSSPSSINVGVSTEYKTFFSYGLKTIDETIPFAEIKNCSSTASKRKFVMVTFGPEVVDVLDDYRGINYNKEYNEPTSCNFKNNPIAKPSSSEERKMTFEKKWNFINKCIEVNVNEMGPHPLVYPKDQEGCVVTPTSTMSAKFTGGYCFFRPNPDSLYNIRLSISESCLSLNGYKLSDVELQDLNAELSAYTSSTYKDDLEDLTTLGTTPVRVSINPDKSILKPTDDFGILRPTFPANYQVNDLHLGKILFSELNNDDINISIPFIVDNFSCAKKNSKDVISSACNYSTPYTGSITLKDSKGKEILTWQDGGIAPANWQGILSGEGYRINKDLIPSNQNYSLEIEFSDPQFSFNSFKKRITHKIGHLNATLPVMSREGTINEISDIRILDEIDKMIEVEPLGVLDFKNPLLSLANSRRRLNGYLSTSLFPPIYEKVCNSAGSCIEADKTFANFTATFKLNSDYSISELQVTRKSDLLGPYTKTTNVQPEYICE